MSKFEVYFNEQKSYAKIHLATCGHLRKHGGENYHDQGWYEAFEGFGEARDAAKQSGLDDVNDCKACKPQAQLRTIMI
jgi:hypothetical protein